MENKSTLLKAGILTLKGICMGAADIVPGVSGGTIAFITGIYDELVDAIRSFDFIFFKKILHLDFSGAVRHVHLSFLLPLLLGIGISLLSMARLMHFFLDQYSTQTWSLFFGLIAASIWVVGKRIGHLNGVNTVCLALGALGSYYIVGLIPVNTPDSLSFLFLCGMIAICAMILPGLSGAFLLLIMGKYTFVTGALKNPLLAENLLVIAVFGCGCIVGIMLFSRVLHYLLQRHHAATISLLTGIMLGAMRKIWPWKEVLRMKIIQGKTYVLATENILPRHLDTQFFWALGFMFVGFILVVMLERLSGGSERA
ncbi:MAG: DUF368 domain-containing protein [Desulfovibrio sp.]|uniref:DUF368 domain-containing protein n=1 Tax=Desulfovibrio sp. 7SRBS1 TaxID=3378064 RepID=UPI003B4271C2